MFKLVTLFSVLALAAAKPGVLLPLAYNTLPAVSSQSQYNLHGSALVPAGIMLWNLKLCCGTESCDRKVLSIQLLCSVALPLMQSFTVLFSTRQTSGGTMKTSYNSSLLIVVGTIAFLLMTIAAAPMEPDEEQNDNELVRAESNELEYAAPWDSLNSAAFRKLLLQLDADERLNRRVGRSWTQAEPREWGLRRPDGRLVRQWRADKRQVRFRQCYFNPISCFRK